MSYTFSNPLELSSSCEYKLIVTNWAQLITNWQLVSYNQLTTSYLVITNWQLVSYNQPTTI